MNTDRSGVHYYACVCVQSGQDTCTSFPACRESRWARLLSLSLLLLSCLVRPPSPPPPPPSYCLQYTQRITAPPLHHPPPAFIPVLPGVSGAPTWPSLSPSAVPLASAVLCAAPPARNGAACGVRCGCAERRRERPAHRRPRPLGRRGRLRCVNGFSFFWRMVKVFLQQWLKEGGRWGLGALCSSFDPFLVSFVFGE